MRVLMLMVSCIAVLLLSTMAQASSVETYTFTKPEYEVRFHMLNTILRCPKCQNQNIADSNSLISQDLRREVKRLLEEGRSDEQIMEHMMMRYGSFVLYKPKVERITYLLWYGPIGFAIFGLLMLMFVVVRQKRKRQERIKTSSTTDSAMLNDDEQADIDKLLNQ